MSGARRQQRPETEAEALPPARPRWVELAIGLGSLAVAGVLVALVPALRHALSLALQGDLGGLRHQFLSLGAAGVALLLGLILLHAVIFYPTELVTATAGLVYGFLPGLALAMGGWLVSGLLAYVLGRTVGEPLARAVFGHRRFDALRHAVERGGIPLLMGLRLIPLVPFSLTGYVAGAARVPVWRFGWTTLAGYLPLCALVAYFGSQSSSLSASDPRMWIALGGIVLLLGFARLLRPMLGSRRFAERS